MASPRAVRPPTTIVKWGLLVTLVGRVYTVYCVAFRAGIPFKNCADHGPKSGQQIPDLKAAEVKLKLAALLKWL